MFGILPIFLCHLFHEAITPLFQDFQNEWFINISKIVLPLSVMMTTFGYGIGCGPVPNSLLGEIIPLKIKSMATAIIISLK